MAVYKVQPMFNQSVMGATESYITGDLGFSELAKFVKNFIAKRNQLLFDVHQWVGIRISQQPSANDLLNDLPARRQSYVLLPGRGVPIPGAREVIQVPANGVIEAGNVAAITPDQFRSVLQLRTTFGVAGNRHSIAYMSMIPDQYSLTEPATKGIAAGWEKNLDGFCLWVIDNCFVKARTDTDVDPIAKANKLIADPADDKRVGIRYTTAGAPVFVTGQKITLQKFKRQFGSNPTLNGVYQVDAVDTTTQAGQTIVYVRTVYPVVVTDWKHMGEIRRLRYAYFSIARYDPYRVGIHKRGRPSMAPHGRRRTRTLLDA